MVLRPFLLVRFENAYNITVFPWHNIIYIFISRARVRVCEEIDYDEIFTQQNFAQLILDCYRCGCGYDSDLLVS